MAVKKWPKWVVGISSVLSFTGFLYMTQKDNPETGAFEAVKPEWNGISELDGSAVNLYKKDSRPDNANGEIFVFDAGKMEQILQWPPERKSDREKLLESLNWDADPDAEITLPAQENRYEQAKPRSSVRTRRS